MSPVAHQSALAKIAQLPETSFDNNDFLPLNHSIKHGQQNLGNHYHSDGYWWYTLEANDSINAEYIILLHYMGLSDAVKERPICRWLESSQNEDGSWGLFHKGPGDISTTVECYIALKLAGYDINSPVMFKARRFILDLGGITKIRIFSRIHLALIGLVDWKICPVMPVSFMQLPDWAPLNIYEFSSWARACIVPLLVIMDQKKTVKIPGFHVDELYPQGKVKKAKWNYPKNQGFFSLENIFIQIDSALKLAEAVNVKPLRKRSLVKCEAYIREHLDETADIYPAMYYSILALHSLGYALTDDAVVKAFKGLASFQIPMSHNILNEIPFSNHLFSEGLSDKDESIPSEFLYQQCCISPVWDTAWAGVALCDSELPPDDEKLIKTARWLLSKQVTDVYGDWSIKNSGVEPGGWSFEFNNKHYPDVDDTIEVLTFLHKVDLPYREVGKAFDRGLKWLLSMQSANGGFAAFDKDNDFKLLNKIPFSDHGACLDSATADLSGRMLEFLINIAEFKRDSAVVQKIADFITLHQEEDGSFWGRWGVNYIYGTWCVLGGLAALGRKQDEQVIHDALQWLTSIQNHDGGFGESCLSYQENRYVALEESTASQTAWALMSFVACGLCDTPAAKRASDFLIKTQNASGGWDEAYHTGTGFPGHFYIRYHGYRHYFPLMALSKYCKALKK